MFGWVKKFWEWYCREEETDKSRFLVLLNKFIDDGNKIHRKHLCQGKDAEILQLGDSYVKTCDPLYWSDTEHNLVCRLVLKVDFKVTVIKRWPIKLSTPISNYFEGEAIHAYGTPQNSIIENYKIYHYPINKRSAILSIIKVREYYRDNIGMIPQKLEEGLIADLKNSFNITEDKDIHEVQQEILKLLSKGSDLEIKEE